MARLSRTFIAAAVLVAMSSLLALSANAADSGELRFRQTTGPTTLDWNLAHAAQETYILMNLMEGLLRQGPDLKPMPGLAKSWEVSADGRTYIFTLREGLKWSDGKPLTAADFEEGWFRLLDSNLKSTYANILFDVENAENYFLGKLHDRSQVGIKAIAAHRFRVRLKYPVRHFLYLTTIWPTFPVRADLIKKHGSEWTSAGKLAVVGPYELVEWEKGRTLRFRKNRAYYAASELATAPDSVRILIERDDAQVRRLFEQGELDFLQDISTEDFLKYKSGARESGPRIAQFPYLATYFIAFNVKSGPLSDPQVRRAIALAIDRSAIPSVLQGGEVVASSLFPPGLVPGSGDLSLTGGLYQAKAELARAGFGDSKPFPQLQFWIEKFDGAERLANHIARGLLERLGIPTEVHLGRSTDYRRAQGAMYIGHWSADYPDAASFLTYFSKNDQNVAYWQNAQYDALFEKGMRARDEATRLQAYIEAEKVLIQQEVAIYPLFHKKRSVLLSPRIDRFEITPLDFLYFRNVSLRPPLPAKGVNP